MAKLEQKESPSTVDTHAPSTMTPNPTPPPTTPKLPPPPPSARGNLDPSPHALEDATPTPTPTANDVVSPSPSTGDAGGDAPEASPTAVVESVVVTGNDGGNTNTDPAVTSLNGGSLTVMTGRGKGGSQKTTTTSISLDSEVPMKHSVTEKSTTTTSQIVVSVSEERKTTTTEPKSVVHRTTTTTQHSVNTEPATVLPTSFTDLPQTTFSLPPLPTTTTSKASSTSQTTISSIYANANATTSSNNLNATTSSMNITAAKTSTISNNYNTSAFLSWNDSSSGSSSSSAASSSSADPWAYLTVSPAPTLPHQEQGQVLIESTSSASTPAPTVISSPDKSAHGATVTMGASTVAILVLVCMFVLGVGGLAVGRVWKRKKRQSGDDILKKRGLASEMIYDGHGYDDDGDWDAKTVGSGKNGYNGHNGGGGGGHHGHYRQQHGYHSNYVHGNGDGGGVGGGGYDGMNGYGSPDNQNQWNAATEIRQDVEKMGSGSGGGAGGKAGGEIGSPFPGDYTRPSNNRRGNNDHLNAGSKIWSINSVLYGRGDGKDGGGDGLFKRGSLQRLLSGGGGGTGREDHDSEGEVESPPRDRDLGIGAGKGLLIVGPAVGGTSWDSGNRGLGDGGGGFGKVVNKVGGNVATLEAISDNSSRSTLLNGINGNGGGGGNRGGGVSGRSTPSVPPYTSKESSPVGVHGVSGGTAGVVVRDLRAPLTSHVHVHAHAHTDHVHWRGDAGEVVPGHGKLWSPFAPGASVGSQGSQALVVVTDADGRTAWSSNFNSDDGRNRNGVGGGASGGAGGEAEFRRRSHSSLFSHADGNTPIGSWERSTNGRRDMDTVDRDRDDGSGDRFGSRRGKSLDDGSLGGTQGRRGAGYLGLPASAGPGSSGNVGTSGINGQTLSPVVALGGFSGKGNYQGAGGGGGSDSNRLISPLAGPPITVYSDPIIKIPSASATTTAVNLAHHLNPPPPPPIEWLDAASTACKSDWRESQYQIRPSFDDNVSAGGGITPTSIHPPMSALGGGSSRFGFFSSAVGEGKTPRHNKPPALRIQIPGNVVVSNQNQNQNQNQNDVALPLPWLADSYTSSIYRRNLSTAETYEPLSPSPVEGVSSGSAGSSGFRGFGFTPRSAGGLMSGEQPLSARSGGANGKKSFDFGSKSAGAGGGAGNGKKSFDVERGHGGGGGSGGTPLVEAVEEAWKRLVKGVGGSGGGGDK
ncbi:hypothetical protein HDU76_006201 [Blyttiomyces sp. JEL0837]|nr:hypothetical protein HDU76_006201 [Blyttiomyces sp. JEL0837]